MSRTLQKLAVPRPAQSGNRGWSLLVPEMFRPKEILPPKLRKHADKASFFVNVIIRKTDADGYAHLHSKIIEQVLGKRRRRAIIEALEVCGVVERDPGYRAGHKSIGYRLSSEYIDQPLISVQPTCPRMIEHLAALERRWNATQASRRQTIHEQLHALQQSALSVDVSQAEMILAKLSPQSRFVQRVLIRNIQFRQMTNSVSTTGRWFNGLTGIQRDLRAALRIDGESMASVDLVCCQPALLALLIKAAYPTLGPENGGTYKVEPGDAAVFSARVASFLPADVVVGSDAVAVREFRFYESLVADGGLYCWLVEASGLSRSEAKRRFLIDLLSQNPRKRYPSVVRDCFRERFPSIFRFIAELNRRDHATLIRLLQRLEALLVLETVAPKLIGRCAFVTLHDAIFCGAKSLPLVKNAFANTLDEIGFRIGMKVEPEQVNQLVAA